MKKLYCIGAALSAMLAACTAETPEAFKVLTVQASQEADTRTAYAGEVNFSWSEGDQISVLCNDGTHDFWQTFTVDQPGASATFSATVAANVGIGPKNLSATAPRLALYPACATHVYENAWTVKYTIPAEKDFRSGAGGHKESAIPMIAWGKEGDTFRFANLTGAVKFTFSHVDASQVKFVFTSTGVRMNGSFSLFWDGGINLDDASNVRWNADNAATDAEKTLTYYADVENGTVSFYIPYATGSIWGSGIRLENALTGAVLYEHDALKTITVSQNRITVLPTIDVATGQVEVPFSSAYGISWDSIEAAENTNAASYPVIKSLKATADDDYLYLLLDMDPTRMEASHEYAHRMYLYAGSWSTQFGHESWAVHNNAPAYYNWQTGYSDCSATTVSSDSWMYEIRISRTHSTTSAALGGNGTVNVGVKLDNRTYDNGTYGYAAGGTSTATIGKIPSGNSLYPVSLNTSGTPLSGSVDVTRQYTQSDEVIANPERGLYKMVEFKYHKRTSDAEHPEQDELETTEITSATSSLEDSYVENSLVLALFYLFDFVDADHISQAGIDYVRAALSNVRAQGKKAVVRFAYNNRHPSKWHMEPEASQILSHIEDLGQTLSDFEDVIYVVQAGFIGTYGEWYYTTHFGPEKGGVEYTISGDAVSGYDNRRAVIHTLLDHVPESRQIELRTPEYKACFVNPNGVSQYSALTSFGTDADHRLAFHNDAFLYGHETDMGTFHQAWQKDMWREQGAWLISGGEAPYSSKPIEEMDGYSYTNVVAAIYGYHYSYLHHDTGYHIHPNSTSPDDGSTLMRYWHQQGWMQDIEKMLGYRLFLTEATVTGESAGSGSTLHVSLTLANSGAARVMNGRPMELVLLHNGDPTVLKADAGDVRLVPGGTVSGTTVTPGSRTFSFDLTLPQALCEGDKLALWLPDADPCNQGLQTRREYSIRLANNETTWTTGGYNVFCTF